MSEQLTKEKFIADVKTVAKQEREHKGFLRLGQSIFNEVDRNYGSVARTAQFTYGVDCFYDDRQVDKFLDTCWDIIEELQAIPDIIGQE